MRVARDIAALEAALAPWRAAGDRIVLVPTMGNLHEGHLSLVDRARRLGDRVVVTLFVNPMQFGPGEDFERYPRTFEEDRRLLEARGADLLFAPETAELYPRGHGRTTAVEVPELSSILCGAFRPGHFRGVATVVAKLYNLVRPQVAVFGEKDYQQLVILRRMTEDLNFPVEVVGAPTVREPDGLAMSSRNRYLTAEERARAPLLYRTLRRVVERVREGARDLAAVEAEAMAALAAAGFRPEYVSVRRAGDLAPPAPGDRSLVVLAAAHLGSARLIDNIPFERATAGG
ncbi:MAG TPA: pantoate--beta-alanine ligase [Chromatiales bacterium]|nr:pantoate--beta-alanine ligase [Chromatiales bacterium]